MFIIDCLFINVKDYFLTFFYFLTCQMTKSLRSDNLAVNFLFFWIRILSGKKNDDEHKERY